MRRIRHRLQLTLLTILTLTAGCAQDVAPPPPPPRPPLEFLGEWGTRGDGPGQFSEVGGFTTDFAGSVYLTDSSSGFVHKFDPTGEPLLSFRDDLLKRPGAIAVDSGGGIYVAAADGRIFIFRPDGERIGIFRSRVFFSPRARLMAIANSGDIYLLDSEKCRILILDPRGRLKRSWGKKGEGPGEFSKPTDITADDSFVYVADVGSGRVQKFALDGQFVTQWKFSEPISAGSETPPVGSIAVSKNSVFLADNSSEHVEIWTLEGQQSTVADLGGSFGSRPEISAMAVARNHELLLLSRERDQYRIKRYRINLH